MMCALAYRPEWRGTPKIYAGWNHFKAPIRSGTTRRPFAGRRCEGQVMSMNKDQVKGRVNEAKGKIKEAAGGLVGNERLKAKGKVQKTLGKAQAKYGDVKQDVKDAIKGA